MQCARCHCAERHCSSVTSAQPGNRVQSGSERITLWYMYGCSGTCVS